MKKIKTLFLTALFLILSGEILNAQVFNFTLTPTVQCYTGNNSLSAGVTFTSPGATSYTWSVAGPSACVSPYSVTPGGMYLGATLPCCGIYTITCYALASNTVVINSVAKTVTVNCSGGVYITSNSSDTLCTGLTRTLVALGGTSYTWNTGATTSSIVVSPTANTCYSVIGASSSSLCGSMTAVKCLYVNSSLALTVIGPNSVCPGNWAPLVASGASSYTWYPGATTGSSITPTFTSSACYTVVGKNSSGCTGSAVKCVSVVPFPTLTLYGSASCNNSPSTWVVSGASNYTWYPYNITGSVAVISPTASSCFSVIGYNSAGCPATTGTCFASASGVSISVSGNSVICAGGSTTLFASGANSYSWTNGPSNSASIVVSPTANTCYTVSGNNSNGCFGSKVYCVIVNNTPSLTVTSGNFCGGGLDSLIAYGANSYTWYPYNVTGPIALVSSSANPCYTLVGSNGPGCVAYATGCWSVSPSPTITVIGTTSLCAGSTATLTASGATYYNWYPGGLTGPNVVVSPSVSTCFTVIGYNANGCSASAVKCVSVFPGSVSVSGNAQICAGGSATLTASGSASYTWLPGNLTGASIAVSPTASTCYTVIGANSAGCSNVAVKCVTVSNQPTVTITGNNSVCQNNWIMLMASGASSYTWLPGGANTTSIAPTPSANTCYTLIGSNGIGCTSSAVKCVSVNPNPTVTVTGNSALCAGQSTTLNASGALTYTWYSSSTLYGNSIVVTPIASTCYSVAGVNAFGCMGVSGICLTVQPQSNVTISGPGNVCQGSVVSFTASGASSYTWSGLYTGNVYTFVALSGTCISVAGSNTCANSTIAFKCFTVNPNPTISISGSGTSCSGSGITLSASGANSYTWSTGATSSVTVVSPTANTCYTVAGLSSAGCSGSAVKCVTVNPGPVLNILGPNSICMGSSAVLTASGAAIGYTWLPGGQSSPSIVVSPGASTCYTLIGSNASGCTSSAVKCISVTPGFAINVSGVTSICSGGSTTLSASGALTYTWFPSGTGSSIIVSPSVTTCYSVGATNAQGCHSYTGICVTVNQTPTLNILGGNQAFCSGSSTTLTATGAANYTWLPGNSNAASVVVSPGTSVCYTLTGANGPCIYSTLKCLTVSPNPVIGVSGNNVLCSGGSAILLASGAVTYTWNTGANAQLISVSPGTNSCYTVTGTNAQGCTGMATKCITVQATPTVIITGDSVSCAGKTILLMASGAPSYNWSTGSSSPSIAVSPGVSTIYTVTGTNGACSGTATHVVSVLPGPVVTAVSSRSAICAGEPVNLVASGAASYTWSTGATGAFISVSPTASSLYTVTGKNSGGCSGTASVYVSVSPCTGIEQSVSETEFYVYPNPGKGEFNVVCSTRDDNAAIDVYNTVGQLIVSQKIVNEVSTVNLTNQANGLYYIKVTSGSKQHYLKVVKQ